MKVSNIRFGHATNSSSSHSIIWGLEQPDHLQFEDDHYRGGDDYYFGWEEFCLSSREAKRKYMATTLYNNLQRPLGNALALEVVRSVYHLDYHMHPEALIDHQSLMTLPVNREGHVCLDFARELRNYYVDSTLSIVGGNDNEEHARYIEGRQPHLIEADKPGKPSVARKDTGTGWWTLYDSDTGAKVRLSLREEPAPYVKASIPELVDISITDYCHADCQWCYRDCTDKGAHAYRYAIQDLLYALGNLGVFEVALGGGEPTRHPDFAEILYTCSRNGITPNFSTQSLDWVYDKATVKAVRKHVGAFGYSHGSLPRLTKALCLFAEKKILKKAAIHVVLGTVGFQEFKEIANICWSAPVPLVLLGFKQVGRGADGPDYPQEMQDCLKYALNLGGRVSLDTAAVKQFGCFLGDVPKVLYDTEEGKFSMFYDAVSGLAGPDSYHSDLMIPCNPDEHDIKRIFPSF